MLEINGFHKFTEKDNYENGCIGKATSFFIDYPIKAQSVDELKRQILSFIDADADAMEANACDEPGRIDVAKMENADGSAPTKAETEAWKRGEVDLYYCVYTCFVEQVTRAPATI